jgi:DNA polymerase V
MAEKSLRAGDINAFFDIEARRPATVPLMATSAACGFPSPADDYLDRPLDFNELLIENPAATFAVRIAGESMTGAGLFPGDIAVVDRARTAVDGSIVLALLPGNSRSSAIARRARGPGCKPRTRRLRTSKSTKTRASKCGA